jgi:hypothetical protein
LDFVLGQSAVGSDPFVGVGGYLGYHINEPDIARQLTIPITEVGGAKQRDLLWKLYRNDSIANATILPDST